MKTKVCKNSRNFCNEELFFLVFTSEFAGIRVEHLFRLTDTLDFNYISFRAPPPIYSLPPPPQSRYPGAGPVSA